MPKKPSPIDVHVGKRVRMQRLMRKMSQGALGEAVGVTFQQVQKYEKGANRIGSSRLHQVAEILGVSVPFFFEGLPDQSPITEPEPSTAFVSEFLASPEGLALAKAFMRIRNAETRRCIVALVEQLTGGREA
jgi:transcriptional regulator with XRE-family HTH domain